MNTVSAVYDGIGKDYASLRGYARHLTDIKGTRVRYENREYAREIVAAGGVPPGKADETYKKNLFNLSGGLETDGLDYDEFILDGHGRFEDLTDKERRSSLKEFKERGVYGLLVAAEKRLEKTLIERLRTLCGPAMTELLEVVGIGEKTVARLLGEIGHPIIAFPKHWEENPDYVKGGDEDKRILIDDAPFERSVSQLWSYCGMGDPERKPWAPGNRDHDAPMTSEEALACGSPFTRSLVYLLASRAVMLNGTVAKNGAVKPRSPYRDIYDETKTRYEGTRPEWSDGHRHNASIRKVGKTMLKDIWVASREDLGTYEVAKAA